MKKISTQRFATTTTIGGALFALAAASNAAPVGNNAPVGNSATSRGSAPAATPTGSPVPTASPTPGGTPVAIPTLTPSFVSITVQGNYRCILSNDIPNHPIGQFPNPQCPNTLKPQNYAFRVTLDPLPAATNAGTCLNPFGVALNGVPFLPGSAQFFNNNPASGWNYEPLSPNVHLGLDQNNGNVKQDGAYDYHGMPIGLLYNLKAGTGMTLVGWAADGYPIYGPYSYSDPYDDTSAIVELHSSYKLKSGKRPTGANSPGGAYDGTYVQDYEYDAGSGDLDQCNGRSGVTPEFPSGTYYYVLSENWPVIPRLFHGTPDPSFAGPPPGGPCQTNCPPAGGTAGSGFGSSGSGQSNCPPSGESGSSGSGSGSAGSGQAASGNKPSGSGSIQGSASPGGKQPGDH